MTSKTLISAVPAPSAGSRLPWVFAAKTTLSALLALLIAFTFNLDDPQWSLLTVFIVSAPRHDGPIFAKSSFRIIGTMVGATVALVLVALAAQERVLFLGALATWVGICTFGSQYAQGWAAYAFVLSGYTAAIVGIPGALEPENAFYIAVARVTEVSLGIIISATVAHLILPEPIAPSLWQIVTSLRLKLGDYAIAVLHGGSTAKQKAELLGQAAMIEDLRRSAIFEDKEIRAASHLLANLVGTLIHVIGGAQNLVNRGEEQPLTDGSMTPAAARAIARVSRSIKAWQAGTLHAAALGESVAQTQSNIASAPGPTGPSSSSGGEQIAGRVVWSDRVERFFAALMSYAEADQALVAGSGQLPPGLQRAIAQPDDAASAALTGLRAALAIVLASSFWILADWPHGSTATVLAAVATARLATMGPHPVPMAMGAALIFSLASFPAFLVVDVVLPLASGFTMFALVVAPALFVCARLMANQKTSGIGFMSALLFASVGAFQNRMVYDPIGLVNTAIAATLAASLAMVLWAVLWPETPVAMRRRFVRAARKAFAPMLAADRPVTVAAFERAIGGALVRFRSSLSPDRPDDAAGLEAGITLLGAGRELILACADRPSLPATRENTGSGRFRTCMNQRPTRLPCNKARRAVSRCLTELRRDPLDVAAVRVSTREITILQNVLGLCTANVSHVRQAEELADVA